MFACAKRTRDLGYRYAPGDISIDGRRGKDGGWYSCLCSLTAVKLFAASPPGSRAVPSPRYC